LLEVISRTIGAKRAGGLGFFWRSHCKRQSALGAKLLESHDKICFGQSQKTGASGNRLRLQQIF
jgi:hypothetical protein